MDIEKINSILIEMEELRLRKQYKEEPTDYIIRVCQAIVADGYYPNRASWNHIAAIAKERRP